MRKHSVVGLITNSSSEVFVGSIKVPVEDIPDFINNLWKVYLTANPSEREYYPAQDDVSNFIDIQQMTAEEVESAKAYYLREGLESLIYAYLEGKVPDNTIIGENILKDYIEVGRKRIADASSSFGNSNFMLASNIAKELIESDNPIDNEFVKSTVVLTYVSLEKGIGWELRRFTQMMEMFFAVVDNPLPMYRGSASNHDIPQDFIVLLFNTLGVAHHYDG